MSQPASFSWRDLHDLFSVVMCIDESMTIVYVSDTLGKCMPQTLQRPVLFEVFNSLRPASLNTFSDGVKSVGSLCLMTAKNEEFAIRGQLLQIDYQGRKVLCFCGAPWLFWINAQAPNVRLGLDDFSAQDVQLDQLFFMSTEKKMVEDLEGLNSDLQVAQLQLEEAQDAQKRFFAQMSHEIRTPLNGVVSALSLLEQFDHGSEQSHFVQLAQSSSENLMQVINYVLNVSKLESPENQEQEQEVFNLSFLIRNTVDVLKAQAEEKSLPIRLELSSQLPQACYGTPDRLRQTLLNLLVNAIKFTIEGEITLHVSTVEREAEQCIIRLELTDTGLGIAEDQLDKIFEPFWSTASGNMAQQEQGTGLGLDIVRRNVRSMGGEVQVQSVLGEGTTFSFELPLKVARSRAADVGGSYARPALSGHVLLVDDNETNRVLGALVLESLGLEVASVDCGNAAVGAVRESQFDLVLMDINMPDIDGIEAARQIRALNPGNGPIIVALTAYVDAEERAACLEVGMSGYLTKPIVRDELARALATWLASDEPLTANRVDDAGNRSGDESTESTEGAESESVRGELMDRQILHELVKQIGQDNVDLVVSKVKIEALQRWHELDQAESAADADAVRRHVHSLGSIFRSVGLLAVGDSLAEIEICLRAGGTPNSGWLQDMQQLGIDSLLALDEELALR